MLETHLEATAGERPEEEVTPTDTPTENTPAETEPETVEPVTETEPQNIDNTIEDKERKNQERFDRRWQQREKKLRDEMQAEFQAQLARERDSIMQNVQPKTQGEVAEWYRELFGDDPAVRNVYGKFTDFLSKRDQQLADSLYARIQQEQQQQHAAVGQWESKIQDRLATLEDTTNMPFLGDSPEAKRNRSEVLAVVDEYTPKDQNGAYLSDFIPFDKALEIVKLKRTQSQAPQRQAQRQAATRTAVDTQSSAATQARGPGNIGSFFNRDVSEFYNS